MKFSRQFDQIDCGPACIRMVASAYGKDYPLSYLRTLSHLTREGVSVAGIRDLVWNARVSKTFTKAGLTVMLDAFDILGNLSNISQVLNSQGRTETYRNSIPRYIMAHVIYRLNKKTRKK